MLDLEESMSKMKVIHVAGTKGKVPSSSVHVLSFGYFYFCPIHFNIVNLEFLNFA